MVTLALAQRLKPGRPTGCEHLTDDYWKFIEGCWDDASDSRPTAAKAHKELLRLRDANLSEVY